MIVYVHIIVYIDGMWTLLDVNSMYVKERGGESEQYVWESNLSVCASERENSEYSRTVQKQSEHVNVK